MAIGKSGQAGAADSTTLLNRPASVDFDATGSEVYVADGYLNRRVIVFDAATGAYKRHWGAYGAAPGENPGAYDAAAPPAKQFRTVTCASVARDGTVYVCDRNSNRIQVFTKDGKFVKESIVAAPTLGSGAVWDIAFSADPQQQLLFVADGQNQRVTVLVRDTLEVLAQVGTGGRYPGQFYGVAAVAVDSRGNLYTGEGLEGKRLQKWNVKK
jgi:DNA-binding beta-propeller fold protein YncE